MKLLLALTTLLATALAALIFPDMKKVLLLIPFALLALTLAGCQSHVAGLLAKMPDGQFTKAVLTQSSAGVTTKIDLAGVRKDNGEFSATAIDVTFVVPFWSTFAFHAEDYELQLTRAAQKKPLSPQVRSGADRPAHNREDAGSSPAPATTPVVPPGAP